MYENLALLKNNEIIDNSEVVKSDRSNTNIYWWWEVIKWNNSNTS